MGGPQLRPRPDLRAAQRTKINTGGGNHTDAFNNRGNLMRACGKASDYPDVACTTWW
ncbi:hypothetical protein ACFV2X_06325 [Streptomyces sp. NPDC059679]|uniref:hypothetical protein n=1 Tax=Streptomyces sp. NPDC059679 TaxID=3346903 RepID=UPI00368FB91B